MAKDSDRQVRVQPSGYMVSMTNMPAALDPSHIGFAVRAAVLIIAATVIYLGYRLEKLDAATRTTQWDLLAFMIVPIGLLGFLIAYFGRGFVVEPTKISTEGSK
jgi:uncharacterized membrane protein